jgi:hypothetical protein
VIRRCLALAALLGAAAPAVAQPAEGIVATGSILLGCRALVENAPTGDMMQIGACAGAVSVALDISRRKARVPACRWRVIDAARVVIMFVDERPERKSDRWTARADGARRSVASRSRARIRPQVRGALQTLVADH